jgi:molecular chaperone GrpE (heat shock protein)
MKAKIAKLFDKAIHEVKEVIGDIQKERESFREDFLKVRDKHDKKMSKMISDLLQALDDLQEIILDEKTGE